MLWVYWLISRMVYLLTSVIMRREVVGLANVPATGPLLLISNHLSLADPPVLGSMFPRPIRFMAKEELFRTPIVSWVVRGYLAFPVRRGEADRQALQTTLRLLQQGEVVGIFPEGTRSRDGQLHPAHPGAALMASRAGAPILPVAIHGSELMFRWPRSAWRPCVRIVVGKPFTLPAAERGAARLTFAKQTNFMMQRIAELLPEQYRGAYAAEQAAVDTLEIEA
ncbi:MAG: lysophospholipid acyltransferase family protein [Chloroflexota bacterium]